MTHCPQTRWNGTAYDANALLQCRAGWEIQEVYQLTAANAQVVDAFELYHSLALRHD